MTALERYIDDLVNDIEPEESGAFPKNESSWEELFDLCTRLIAEIVTLRRAACSIKRAADLAICAPDLHALQDEQGLLFCGYCGHPLSL